MSTTGSRLGRIFGIELRLDPSIFIALFLITWLLAAGQFPANFPNWAPLAYWWVALMSAIALFASVLTHELSHAFVARRFGIPVSEITLFLFGGAARLSREPRRAREEVAIAVAGPVASLLLAVGFGGLWLVGAGLGEPTVALLGWLASANFILAVFNLVPAFPMDGGRIARAAVWAVTGDPRRATLVAAGLGRIIAYGFIAWGALQIAGGNWAGGIWMALIGWFLAGAAGRAYQQADLARMAEGLLVRDVMTQPATVHPWLTVDVAVAQVLAPSGQRVAAISEGREWRGLLSVQALRSVSPRLWPTTRVAQVMIDRSAVPTARPDDPLEPVVSRMVAEGLPIFAVAEGDELLGVLDAATIMSAIGRRREWSGDRRAA